MGIAFFPIVHNIPSFHYSHLFRFFTTATKYGAMGIFFHDRKEYEWTANGRCTHGGRKVPSVFGLLVYPALTCGSQAPARTRHKPAGPRKGIEFDHEKRYPWLQWSFRGLYCYKSDNNLAIWKACWFSSLRVSENYQSQITRSSHFRYRVNRQYWSHTDIPIFDKRLWNLFPCNYSGI